ncbi:restriction endonuclease subunit S, partial [Escherichia coli]
MSEMSYLEKLLDGVEVEWLPLGEVSALRRGRVMSKGYLTENFGPYPVYSSQTANNGKIGSINTFDFDGEYISWTTDGANAGTVFYRTGKFSITNVCGLITLKSKYPLIYKFLFYWLTIEAKKHVYSGMGNPKLMSHQVENIPVPIPCPDNPEKSLAIQSEIVRVLDKFTALTAELTAELNMRKKQYNYYRDQLLSFKEDEVEWKTLGEVAQYSKTRISFELLDERNYVGVDNLLQNRAGKSLSNHVPTSGKLTEFIPNWICPYISRYLLSLNPLLA